MNIEDIRELTKSQKEVVDTTEIIEYRAKIEDCIKEWAMKGRNACAYPFFGFWDKPYIIAVAEHLRLEGYRIGYDASLSSGNISIGW